MFGDMLGDMQEKQDALRQELSQKIVRGEAGGEAVIVESNAIRELVNISINKDKVEELDMEELEDLILVAANRALEKAAEVEATASQELLKNMMPPGLGDLGNMFGG